MKTQFDSTFLPKIDASLRFQAARYVKHQDTKPVVPGPVVTLSREFGCEGYAVAAALQTALSKDGTDWIVYSRGLHEALASEGDPVSELADNLDENSRDSIQEFVDHVFADKPTDYIRFKTLAQNIKMLSLHGKAIVLGSAGAVLTQTDPNAFHVRLIGSDAFRTRRIATTHGLSPDEARAIVAEQNASRIAFVQKFTHTDIRDAHLYDLIIRNDRFSPAEIAGIICQAMAEKGLR